MYLLHSLCRVISGIQFAIALGNNNAGQLLLLLNEACVHASKFTNEIATQPSLSSRIELGGKPKWIPLNLDTTKYLMRTASVFFFFCSLRAAGISQAE